MHHCVSVVVVVVCAVSVGGVCAVVMCVVAVMGRVCGGGGGGPSPVGGSASPRLQRWWARLALELAQTRVSGAAPVLVWAGLWALPMPGGLLHGPFSFPRPMSGARCAYLVTLPCRGASEGLGWGPCPSPWPQAPGERAQPQRGRPTLTWGEGRLPLASGTRCEWSCPL